MRILWVSIEPPYPANTGGRLGIWNRLKRLAKEHEVYYFHTYDGEDEAHIPQLEELCAQVYSIRRKKTFALIPRMIRYPYTVASRCMSEMEQAIDDCIRQNDIQLINLDFPHMCAVVEKAAKKYGIPVVLNEHNIEWKVYRQISASADSPVKRLVYYVDSWRLKWYEERIVRRIKPKGITFVSQENLKEYAQWLRPSWAALKLIPVGIESDVVCVPNDCGCRSIAFFGKMSYEPNVEGAIWFAQEVFPTVKAAIPGVKLYIVGMDPTDQVKALACNDVIVTGTVLEVASYYERANLVVIPLLHGDGVKVKLLEAISYGNQIVSTTKGVEGTDFASNSMIPVSDNPVLFAQLCIDRLQNPERYADERKQAFDYCMEHYTWDGICRNYSDFLMGIEAESNGKDIY